LPENENAQPLLICMVRPCALALPAAASASAHVTIAILFMRASPMTSENRRDKDREKNSSANESFDLDEIGPAPTIVRFSVTTSV
jgi:hypothetical protein